MEAWSLDDFLLNHIGCCGLVFLLDASLLIVFLSITLFFCGLVFLLDTCLVIGYIFHNHLVVVAVLSQLDEILVIGLPFFS